MTVADVVLHNADSSVVTDELPTSAKAHRPEFPDWVSKYEESWGEVLKVEEWKEEEESMGEAASDQSYRQKQGWQGRDLIHDVHSPVRIVQYYVLYGTQPLTGLARGGMGTLLTGVVHFSKRAESHQGFCHGGSMTSVMDDVIGWVAFMVTGQCRPWSGYTVQINTSLKRPIPVDTHLVVQATITNVLRRKISVEAIIFDPSDNEYTGVKSSILSTTTYATAEGLAVINRGILPADYDRSSTMSTASSSMSDA